VLIFDAHLDLAWNALDWNRNLALPVAEIRRQEQARGQSGKGQGCNTVSFPALRDGKVGIFIATLLARLFRPTAIPAVERYSSMHAAYAAAQGQLNYYRLLEEQGVLRWIRDRNGLQSHARAWLASGEPKEPLGFILSMEGADPILSPSQVAEWWLSGLRIVGLTHYGVSPYAHGTGATGGLFPEGRSLLRAMEEVGMILDVTHLSDEGFDEALDLYSGPVLASHHNCRSLVPHQRQLTDGQIKRLVQRGAVIGMALDAWMLSPGWVRGETTPEQAGVRLEAVIDHIDHVCQIAGNIDHVGLGTDLDGGFGREQCPSDLDTIADLQQLGGLLARRGYDAEAIKKVLHGNWLHFFETAWP
jgi:membrane dipeptidase